MFINDSTISRYRNEFLTLMAILLVLSGGCARVPAPAPAPPVEPAFQVPAPPPTERERRSTDFVVLIANQTDTYESLARYYLGDEKFAYLISNYNKDEPIVSGKTVVIPLQPENPGGLYTDGYQTVPVLCYHRFSPKKSSDKITVSAETFDRQMAYLKINGYNVITLKQFFDFLDYRLRPPQKSVLITIDDGLKSVKTIAYPILKKYGFPVVLFVNTDNTKTNHLLPTLSWDELREMKGTGLFEVESHTATHTDLTKLSDEQLQNEIGESKSIIQTMMGVSPTAIAYPFGLFNNKVVEVVKKSGYKGAFTVIRGGNGFFSNHYSINRSMVYNSEKIEDFKKMLETYRQE